MEVAMTDESRNYNDGNEGRPDRPKTFEIKIDRTGYKVSERMLTGAQLRALPEPDIGPDRDLFEVVPGGSDLKIEADTQVEMRNGLRFFTAPAQINPGR
jgi:Multiubiquitin